MISEREAVDVVRAFLASEKHGPWDDASVRVHIDTVEGHRAWVISALDALPPGDEEWMRGDYERVQYFVDMKTGSFFGFEVRGSRTIFQTRLSPTSISGL